MKPPAGTMRGMAARGPGGSVNVLAAGPVPPLRHRPRRSIAAACSAVEASSPPSLPPATRGARGEAGPRRGLDEKSVPNRRNQENRGTCVAFASVAFLEFQLSGGKANTKPLSEQFVYWACKKDDSWRRCPGQTCAVARKALATHGACRAATWKYEALPVARQRARAATARRRAEAKRNRWKQARALTRSQLADIGGLRTRLDAKSRSSSRCERSATGTSRSCRRRARFRCRSRPTPDGGHAIVPVGYETSSSAPGGGAFIFRNSWGKDWGRHGRHGKGYGTLFFDYVKDNALEAFC